MRPLGGTAGVGGERGRAALGIAVGVAIAVVSYAAQRLGSWALGEPGPGAALASIYTAYFWRLGLALLHGAVAGGAVGLAVGEDRARAWLGRAGPTVVSIAVVCGLAMVAVP